MPHSRAAHPIFGADPALAHISRAPYEHDDALFAPAAEELRRARGGDVQGANAGLDRRDARLAHANARLAAGGRVSRPNPASLAFVRVSPAFWRASRVLRVRGDQ